MPDSQDSLFQSVLSTPWVLRTRQNHGLEHATLHILAQRHPQLRLGGHSSPGGFWLFGEVPTEEVKSAVDEAHRRLKAGEGNLAIHPNCGTNMVTSGVFAGMAGALAMFGAGRRFKNKLERLPLAFSLATVGLLLAQPLGALLQEKVTTSSNLGSLEVVEVIPTRRGGMTAHRVITRE